MSVLEIFKRNCEGEIFVKIARFVFVASQVIYAEKLPAINGECTNPITLFVIYRHVIIVIIVAEAIVLFDGISIFRVNLTQTEYICTQTIGLDLAFSRVESSSE